MSNVRNSRTTHPRKTARRQRAAERFGINTLSFKTSKAYARNKQLEANALGLNWEAYVA